MLTLVGAGWHWFRDRFAGADLAAPGHRNPAAGRPAPTLTTFPLRRRESRPEPIKRFISRVKAIGGHQAVRLALEREPPEPEPLVAVADRPQTATEANALTSTIDWYNMSLSPW